MLKKIYRNPLRLWRIKLKIGYQKVEPENYVMMKRYPPMMNVAEPTRKIETKRILYSSLYDEAVERIPNYADEDVYPDHWRQEPQALTLAKKQYEYMQKGMDKEAAFQKAAAYVEELEAKNYDRMQDLMSILKEKGVEQSFAANPEILSEINKWQQKLSKIPYIDLDLAEQGELDYFIQTQLLKWGEVERERRMKDSVFAWRFHQLRETLFPDLDTQHNAETLLDLYNEDMMMSSARETLMNSNDDFLSTYSPFYYEDYQRFFNKLKANPYLMSWTDEERDELSRFVLDTLTFRDTLEKKAVYELQIFVDSLREQYFPMIRCPERANQFSLPSLSQLKEILYSNEIGYSTIEDKTFIRRFYRLPLLLFPYDIFVSKVASNKSRLDKLLNCTDSELLKEVREAGLPENNLALSELQEKLKNAKTDLEKGFLSQQMPEYDFQSGVARGVSGLDAISALKELMNEENRGDTLLSKHKPVVATTPISTVSSFSVSSSGDVSSSTVIATPSSSSPSESTSIASTTATASPTPTTLPQVANNKSRNSQQHKNQQPGRKHKHQHGRSALPAVGVVSKSSRDIVEQQMKAFRIASGEQAPDVDSMLAPVEPGTPRWEELKLKYKVHPTSRLEQDRDKLYEDSLFADWRKARSEAEFLMYSDARMAIQMESKIDLAMDFEEKEAARKSQDWERRELVDLPPPELLMG